MSNITVFLPSRRSSNELKRIFLENSKNKSLILPTIKAIGDVDYDDILLNNIDSNILNSYNEITKPISNIKYKLLLIKIILNDNKNININKAINLSKNLNSFLIEIEKNNLKIDDLNNVVDDEYAIHWQQIIKFLKILGGKWKNYLNENNIISKNTNILKTIEIYTKLFENRQPEYPIIVAVNFVSVKNTMILIKTLSKYNNTYFFTKGLENSLDDNEFEDINETHSHFYFKNILKELNIKQKNISDIKYEDCKIVDDKINNTINNAMLPASLTYKWHNIKAIDLTNVSYIECENRYEELNLIIFYILNYINNNGMKNIAIVSDIEHAMEIETFLKKWNLPFNNNFGRNFLFTNLVKYLFLVVNVYDNNFSIEFLLSLLKHKLTYFGYSKDELEKKIKLFELYVLNNKINNNGLESYKKNIFNIDNTDIKKELNEFIDRIKEYFSVFDNNIFSFTELLNLHIDLINKITFNTESNDNIWFMDKNNEKIFEFIQDLIEQSECFGNIGLQDYISLLSYLFSEQSYNENYSIYPAINIISIQETKLINYDLIVISNLNDGIFPVNIPTDPYMSKSMRLKFGLPAKETEIGESCYNFIQLLMQKEVLLTRAKKVNNETTFESRFLQKIKIFLQCNDLKLKTCDDLTDAYNFYINVPYNENNKIYKKYPNPIPDEKLSSLSATNIELLNKNPYDIYVKKFLKLYKLNIISKQNGYAVIGTVIHEIFELYCKNYDKYSNNFDAVVKLIEKILDKYFIDDKILFELYFEKIVDIVKDFIEKDKISRTEGYSVIVENLKEYFFKEKNFLITAKIDRLEILNNNFRIIDYKTGSQIYKNDVINGYKMQLLIEALILIKTNNKINIESLQYWMTKYNNANSIIINESLCDLINKTEKFILDLIKYFNENKCGFIATAKNQEYSDYNLLSRLEEWLYE